MREISVSIALLLLDTVANRKKWNSESMRERNLYKCNKISGFSIKI